ncbi:MAG: isoprenyl transferase [Bacteroidia bacterium]|nr:isoprenyl transferase [Bacteroidia bacterium]
MSLKEQIQPDKLPKHIAIIMDGNGRWANKRGNLRVFGHRSAIKAVRDVTEGAAELGIEYLTLYAFSTENWNRPKKEVSALMTLLVETIGKETTTLMKNDIRLNAIGHLERLPGNCEQVLSDAMDKTKGNKRMTLTLALSYGGRADIIEATRKLAQMAKEGKLDPAEMNEEIFSSALSTASIPDPELMIRTSGEYRISNFLLWELAYSELFITETLWPDYRRENLYEAIIDYQKRERRFGKISEQIQS